MTNAISGPWPEEEPLETSRSEADGGRLPHEPLETEQILNALIDIVKRARPMPMSSSSLINKDEVLELLEEAITRLPDEFRSARWLVKERNDFLVRAREEGDQLISRARDTAQRMVQRTELVRVANEQAQRVVAEARNDAKKMRLQTEDWCDHQLGRLEVALHRISRAVETGRSRMQGTTQEQDSIAAPPPPTPESAFFDQERE